jgi:hypothetical protein
MKKISVTILCLIAISTCFSQQSIYYKTDFLRSKYSSTVKKIPLDNDVKDVLKEFYPGTDKITVELLDKNPFFKGLFEDNGGASLRSFADKGLSSIGALDVTNLADGFARFIVKRTKEELSVSFFDKFRELIGKPEYKDAQLLFPQTYGTLTALGDKIYNYKVYINVLRESFEADLTALLPNMQKVIEDDSHIAFFKAHPEVKAICLSSIYVGNALLNKQHPGRIIAEYPTDIFLADEALVDTKGAAKTLQLFSESIRSKGSAHYWVGTDTLRRLVEDATARNIYLGLIYRKGEGITFSSTSLQAVLTQLKEKDNTEEIIFYVKEFQRKADLVTEAIKNVTGKEQAKLSFSDYYNFYNATLNLVEHGGTIHTVSGLISLKPSTKMTASLQVARMGGFVALDINRRNYSSAVVNIYQLYNLVAEADHEKAKQFIIKYGSFMAAVAQAETSDEIESAIETAALPSGSSRIKRETPFNVSLNAYAGLFAGYEKIKGVDSNGSKLNSFGVSAPVGISINRGHSLFFIGTGKKGWKENKCSWSTSLFLTVVDIGALAAFRFANDSTESVPKIQLKDIISPGVFLSIGVPKTPLSFNVGYQVGPLLREVTQQKNTYEKNYSRVSISLCVDIPLLNFYTKSKDY